MMVLALPAKGSTKLCAAISAARAVKSVRAIQGVAMRAPPLTATA